MTHDDESKPLSELLEAGTTLMVGSTTGVGGFRPLTVAGLADDRIHILLDTNEQWVSALDAMQSLHVTLSDERKNNWAWMVGEFHLSHDPSLIDELWNPFADAYFDNGHEEPRHRRAGDRRRSREVLVGAVRPDRQPHLGRQGQAGRRRAVRRPRRHLGLGRFGLRPGSPRATAIRPRRRGGA